ncbi:hypothetical protein ABZV67_22625 [Streptomyces sp. NPDC005065]|uniref:hypothetical protein n=1 Tax=unclassified Streptomyces TaxID=2593676 RepID=UPI0033BF6809
MRRNWPGSGQVPRFGPDLVGVTDADEVRAAAVYAAGRGRRDAERTGRGRALRTLALTGPRAPMMTVVQISHLGRPPAAVPNAVPRPRLSGAAVAARR